MNATATPTVPDTIAARATAPGPAAIAVVRISGPAALACAEAVAGAGITPRTAVLRTLRTPGGQTIDQGLVLYFPAPHSYTGEDVVEFQCHGADMVVDWLLETLHALGARPATAGEFSLRAFLNDKLDLTQAEAVADLIASQSRAGAQAAIRSLTGEFATAVAAVQSSLTTLRVHCEAWLDFPDEDIEPAEVQGLVTRAHAIDAALARLEDTAGAGAALTDGLTIAIAGAPNAGKSSLLNRLVAIDAAIVSELPGTTRDALERRAVIAGIPVDLIDTAGLREATDTIERAGIERARAAIGRADLVLWVADIRDAARAVEDARAALPAGARCLLVLNKVDLVDAAAAADTVVHVDAAAHGDDRAHVPVAGHADAAARATSARQSPMTGAPASSTDSGALEITGHVAISALTGAGVDALSGAIASFAGVDQRSGGTFSARRRHLRALAAARQHVGAAATQLDRALDLAAEELRQAQLALAEVTGDVTSDDLLGAIFSTFCIGK